MTATDQRPAEATTGAAAVSPAPAATVSPLPAAEKITVEAQPGFNVAGVEVHQTCCKHPAAGVGRVP